MMYQGPDIDSLVARVLAALEGEASLLCQRQGRLAELSDALLRGDADGLERVLEQIDREESAPRGASPDDVLGSLAAAVGCPSGRPALAEIIPRLPAWHRPAVERARAGLLGRVHALRRQHLQTAKLLSQCASFHRSLMELLLPGSAAVATYDSGGQRQWRSGGGLVNAER
jgi:hypothetical protein